MRSRKGGIFPPFGHRVLSGNQSRFTTRWPALLASTTFSLPLGGDPSPGLPTPGAASGSGCLPAPWRVGLAANGRSCGLSPASRISRTTRCRNAKTRQAAAGLLETRFRPAETTVAGSSPRRRLPCSRLALETVRVDQCCTAAQLLVHELTGWSHLVILVSQVNGMPSSRSRYSMSVPSGSGWAAE